MFTPTEKKISVVMLDDHPMVRLSFEIATRKEKNIELAGSFGRSKELLDWLKRHDVDVLVLDYMLDNDEVDGLSLIKLIMAHYPEQRILLSSSMESLAVIHAALRTGIKGYINKREEPERYFEAIRTVAAGKLFLSRDVEVGLSQMPQRKNSLLYQEFLSENTLAEQHNLSLLLTPRESEVLRCYMDGLTVSDIGIKLNRSRKTVSSHKQSGMKKLGVNSDIELLKYRHELFE